MRLRISLTRFLGGGEGGRGGGGEEEEEGGVDQRPSGERLGRTNKYGSILSFSAGRFVLCWDNGCLLSRSLPFKSFLIELRQ